MPDQRLGPGWCSLWCGAEPSASRIIAFQVWSSRIGSRARGSTECAEKAGGVRFREMIQTLVPDEETLTTVLRMAIAMATVASRKQQMTEKANGS